MFDSYVMIFLLVRPLFSTPGHCPWQGHVYTPHRPLEPLRVRTQVSEDLGRHLCIRSTRHRTRPMPRGQLCVLNAQIFQMRVWKHRQGLYLGQEQDSHIQTFVLTSRNKLGCGLLIVPKFQLCQCKRLSAAGHRQEQP